MKGAIYLAHLESGCKESTGKEVEKPFEQLPDPTDSALPAFMNHPACLFTPQAPMAARSSHLGSEFSREESPGGAMLE